MRVNIGCGATPTEGWVNFDNSLAIRVARRPKLLRALALAGLLTNESLDLAALAVTENVRFANAVTRIPCRDSSVDTLYSAHMVEHLDRDEVRRFLGEARRVLRPGGILRIAVPDIGIQVDRYLDDKDADEFIAGTHLSQPRPSGFLPRIRCAVIGPRHHLWMYDGDSLSNVLWDAGFAGVCVLGPGETTIADPGSLDLKERADESVYAEAVNPG